MAGMFDINGGEWFIILLVALVVVGPRRLPELAKKAGTWLRSVRAMATDFRVGLEREIAELEEPLQSVKGDLAQPLKSVGDEIKAVRSELKDAGRAVTGPLEWTGPTPDRGPTPADAAADLARINEGEDLHLAGAVPADEDGARQEQRDEGSAAAADEGPPGEGGEEE